MDKFDIEQVRSKPFRHNRIAVLGAEINEAYQSELWRGIAEEAGRFSKDIICFLGSRGNTAFKDEEKSTPFYRLAHSGNFDGIIIISSAVSTYLGPEQVRSLFDSRPLIPKISIGFQLEGVGSVCVDGSDAMGQVTEHLITRHQRKNFALIAGPEWHPESEQRRLAILQKLDQYGLNLDRDLLIFGGFEVSSGRKSVRELLARGKPIDTVLCLNDQMAMGAVAELTSLGISVPDSIAVCGFDGIEESEYCSPPLTTVAQPLYQVGVTAVQELYRLMEGLPPRDVKLNCRPVYRQSCSCGFDSSGMDIKDHTESPSMGDDILAETFNQEIIHSSFTEKGGELFLQSIDSIVKSSMFNHHNLPLLEEAIGRLENDTPQPFSDWLPVLRTARKILWEAKNRYLISRQFRKKYRSDMLRSVSTSLSGVFEFPELFLNLAAGLKNLGFNHGFLVMYDDRTEDKKLKFQLVFCLKNGEFCRMEPRTFDNSEVLPDISRDLETDDCKLWMFTPLVFQKKAIGHMLLPGSYPDPEIYETLTKQIASSLQGALLLEQVRTHEQSLVQEVQKRTQELTEANRNLIQEIGTRIRLEQEVVDISKHTMERIGQDLHDDLCQHLAGVSLHISALRHRVEKKSPETVPTIDSINNLLSDSIKRAKGIVRGLLPIGISEEGGSRALEILCLEMSRSSGMKIIFTGNDDFRLLPANRAIELYRIVQEGLNNSVKHSRGSMIEVTLNSEQDGEVLKFSAIIQDNGIGFTPEADAEGMGLKIMKYRGERADIDLEIESTGTGTRVVCRGIQRISDD
ncbi:substrate-binding domain-containing protein [Oceanispirochaeta sp.]|jgi:DNA-binding LacI/PurR family transcriptional regulator/signal transduction histidine kinase|uniref:substrate-binding domain-containing protein n=1 Tax=Oceanispirochaeta sp. TaxID=2035350 RepID=UPI0026081497|nr:substrate-binding domain-containing protein [Oceanispirochaeta sp.]MDA3956268.1 substrate-binding domain-containing protein [Oceanispirochaeta sp.]